MKVLGYKISGFKRDKNKRFNYIPRHYKTENSNENMYEFGSMIRKVKAMRTESISNSWEESRVASRNRGNYGMGTTFWVVLLVLVMIVFYILDFDFSIFFNKK